MSNIGNVNPNTPSIPAKSSDPVTGIARNPVDPAAKTTAETGGKSYDLGQIYRTSHIPGFFPPKSVGDASANFVEANSILGDLVEYSHLMRTIAAYEVSISKLMDRETGNQKLIGIAAEKEKKEAEKKALVQESGAVAQKIETYRKQISDLNASLKTAKTDEKPAIRTDIKAAEQLLNDARSEKSGLDQSILNLNGEIQKAGKQLDTLARQLIPVSEILSELSSEKGEVNQDNFVARSSLEKAVEFLAEDTLDLDEEAYLDNRLAREREFEMRDLRDDETHMKNFEILMDSLDAIDEGLKGFSEDLSTNPLNLQAGSKTRLQLPI